MMTPYNLLIPFGEPRRMLRFKESIEYIEQGSALLTPQQSQESKTRDAQSSGRMSTAVSTPFKNMSKSLTTNHSKKKDVCFVCHRCLTLFYQMSDITRHVDRKHPCLYTYDSPYTDDIVNQLSFKKYYINGLTNLLPLTITEKKRLILDYNLDKNDIPDNFFDREATLLVSGKNTESSTSTKNVVNTTNTLKGMSTLLAPEGSTELQRKSSSHVTNIVSIGNNHIYDSDDDSDDDSIVCISGLSHKLLPEPDSKSPDGNRDMNQSSTCAETLLALKESRMRKHCALKDDALQKYIISVDGIKKYKCTRCFTTFNQKRFLVNHLSKTKTCESRLRVQKLLERELLEHNHINPTITDDGLPSAVDMSLLLAGDLQSPSALSGQDGHPKKVEDNRHTIDHCPEMPSNMQQQIYDLIKETEQLIGNHPDMSSHMLIEIYDLIKETEQFIGHYPDMSSDMQQQIYDLIKQIEQVIGILSNTRHLIVSQNKSKIWCNMFTETNKPTTLYLNNNDPIKYY